MVKYKTWKAFRLVLESRLSGMTEAMWLTLEEHLYLMAIREPFTNGDIDIAVKLGKKLKARWGK